MSQAGNLNASGGGGGAITFVTDSGNATPAGAILNVLGDGLTITTSGAGNTITISALGGDMEPVLIEEQIIAGADEVVFDDLPTTYNSWLLVATDFNYGVNTDVSIQLSTDNGGTWITSSADYYNAGIAPVTSGIRYFEALGATPAIAERIVTTFFYPLSSTFSTRVSETDYINEGPKSAINGQLIANSATNAFRLIDNLSALSVNGTYRLYGVQIVTSNYLLQDPG